MFLCYFFCQVCFSFTPFLYSFLAAEYVVAFMEQLLPGSSLGWNTLRLNIPHKQNAMVLSLFWEKNYFKLINLFEIFVSGITRQPLYHECGNFSVLFGIKLCSVMASLGIAVLNVFPGKDTLKPAS